MRTPVRCLILMGFFFTLNQGCSSQEKPIDRKPAVSGRFYPSDPAELRSALAEMFTEAKPATATNVKAVICPHAGYVFSGKVAASGYNQVDPDKAYDNIFIIASSHQLSFPGASIYNRGDYITPLGRVTVNRELADKLIREDAVFCFNPEADATEHSLEVQIPFLQFHMRKEFRIVPIVLGTQSAESCKKIARLLKPYFDGNNLFVISTDFSHYPAHADAQVADKATCDAIAANSPEKLLLLLDSYRDKNIPNLATNLCGWTSVLTLLYMTAGNPDLKIIPVEYMNSGDSKFGDKKQVVGYWSLAVSDKSTRETKVAEFNFTIEEKAILLGIARNTINKYIRDRRIPEADTTGFSANLRMHAGAFVTLKEKGELRGCIGRFTANSPLYKVIRDMAIAAATEDTRFEPVSIAEIDRLEIEISVLSPMKKISSPDEIILGKHGIYIRKGYLSGTFLPQVATETGWSREEFLGHCSREKAGLGWEGWKSAELFTYEACVFSEREISGRK